MKGHHFELMLRVPVAAAVEAVASAAVAAGRTQGSRRRQQVLQETGKVAVADPDCRLAAAVAAADLG